MKTIYKSTIMSVIWTIALAGCVVLVFLDVPFPIKILAMSFNVGSVIASGAVKTLYKGLRGQL